MKYVFLSAIFSSALICIYGQNTTPSDPEWKATVKVVDESGLPIEGADVTISYFVKPPPDESIAFAKKTGKSDANGIFYASEHSTSIELQCSAEKSGCYRTFQTYELGFALNYDPVKWSPHLTLLLRRIGQPIPMYAKKIHGGPPVSKQPVGYDLTIGDWVAPYGRGQRGDIIFTTEFTGKSPYDYESKLMISFPNPGDGIQKIERQEPLNEGSFLKSPHEAPATGYQPQMVKEESAHPGQERKEPDNNPNRIYLIRVQSFFDQNGNVKSALYGKIYGDFMEFSYYLNPTPNSRNLEFDPKQNLLKNLKELDQVKAP